MLLKNQEKSKEKNERKITSQFIKCYKLRGEETIEKNQNTFDDLFSEVDKQIVIADRWKSFNAIMLATELTY